MNKRIAVILGMGLVLVVLFIVGFNIWQIYLTDEAKRLASAPVKQELVHKPKQDSDTLWRNQFEPMKPSDLVVLPVRDESRLWGQYNYEIRNYPLHLLRALTFLGGKPMQCPEAWPVAAALNLRGVHYLAVPRYTTEELVDLGRELKTDRVIQIVISWETGGMVASATGVEVESGKLLGPWQARFESEKRSYESLFEVETAICLEMAKDLCGVSEETLFQHADATPEILTAIEQVNDLLMVPALPNLLKAYRIAVKTVDKNPHNAKAWAGVCLAGTDLALCSARSENQTWREMTLRSLVAGEIARRLDPDNPEPLIVYTTALIASGRIAESLEISAEARKANPDDKLIAAWDEAVWGRSLLIDTDQTPGVIPDRIHLAYSKISGRYAEVTEWYSKCLERQPLAPFFWFTRRGEGNLNKRRQCNVYIAIQGSLIGCQELIRQLEMAGDLDKARQQAQKLLQILSLDPDSIPEEGVPSEHLSRILPEWARNFTPDQIPWPECFWHENTLVYRILKHYSEGRKALPQDMLAFDSLCASTHGLSLSSRQWIELAETFAIIGSVEILYDIGDRLVDLEQTEKLVIDLERFFPENTHILNEIGKVYYYTIFNPGKVDHYRNHVLRIDPSDEKARRIETIFSLNNDKTTGFRHLNELKYHGPFKTYNLRYIAEKFCERMNYSGAADYYDLLSFRDPRDKNVKATAIALRARAENRLLSATEVESIEFILPPNYPDRTCLLADVYCSGRQFDKAIEKYEELVACPQFKTEAVFDTLATLYLRRGETSKALETLELYVQRVPDRLLTIEVLVRKCDILLRLSNRIGAWREWKRAEAVDNWKGDTIVCHAKLLELEGDREGAIAEVKRNAERYPGDASYAELGWTYYRLGELDEAMRTADEAIQRWHNHALSQVYWLKSKILRKQNRSDEARTMLQQHLRSSPKQVYGYHLLARHYLATGNFDLAIETLDKGLPFCMQNDYRSALETLIFALILKGDFDRAEREIGLYESLKPTSYRPDNLKARIALRRADPEKALELLRPGLNSNSPEAVLIAASAWLDLGDAKKALTYAQKSIDLVMYPGDQSLLVKGKAMYELGNKEEARKCWEACVENSGPDAVCAKEAAELLRQLS